MELTHPLADRDAPTPAAVTAPDGQTYPVADDGTVDVPDAVADALRATWAERWGAPREEDGPPDASASALDPGGLTVTKLRAALSDFDDADLVREMRDAEAANKNRTTALEAIDARLAELED
jgi:hypothetical protein